MSVDGFDCEPYTIEPHTRKHRARKEHTCSACRETIRRGDIYYYEFSVFDGEAETVKRCSRCEAMYGHLVERHRGMDDQFVARELNCGHSYKEVFGEEPPPDVAALAFLLPGEIAIGVKA